MVDPSHESPHASNDPAYCETWAYTFTDLEHRTSALVHASWLPARGVGNHLVTLQRDGKSLARRVETHDPFRSSLLTLEVDPWRAAAVRCPELELDLTWNAFTPPIDFGDNFDLGDRMHQRHVQAGVRASGTLGGARLSRAPGFRDRSWGPRDLRRMGRIVTLLMTGVEREIFVTVNAMTHCDRPYSASPDTTLGCSVIDGDVRVWSTAPIVRRHSDGTPACFELPGDLAIDLDLEGAFHEGRFVADRTSAPEGFPTAEPVLMIRMWALAAEARGLGRMAGSYQEGFLLTN
jgi:hypothetical protein